MLAKAALAILATWALTVSAPAAAQSQTKRICIRAQPLSSALLDLARQTGVELLSDPQIMSGLRAPSVCGSFTAETALRRLLAGSGLTVRRNGSDPWIIERPQAPAVEDPPDPPTPEILVVGKRTQNNDIRRTESDIQPYRVATRQQIVYAHRDTIDQYFQSRITANAQAGPPNLLQKGDTNSAIDLRGLGTESTLLLVDGRRLPSPPATFFGFNQADLNAIPLYAIERIETLTGTAGGIYGFGALGGVVNVVLRRDYRGLELHATTGISTRGDAARLRIEGRLGFTPDGGATDVMIALSHSGSQPLEVGQRDYNLLDRRQSYARFEREGNGSPPPGNAVAVSSDFPWAPLVFKSEYGGGALGSYFTFLPLGFAGDPAKLPAALLANAGRVNADLTEDEEASEIGSRQIASTAIFNVRHRFGGGIEGYFDALVLRNRGRHILRAGLGDLVLAADDPANPFVQPLVLIFPTPPQVVTGKARYDSTRYTGGLIADLPSSWRGTAEATFGEAVYATNTTLTGVVSPPGSLPGEPIDPAFNPLGNWAAFQQAIAAQKFDSIAATTTRNRYREQSLRLAGPVFRTATGPAVLTLLAEHRGERVDGYSQTGFFDTLPTKDHVPTFWATDTTSFYGELRSHLLGDAAPLPLLRDLEVQLAVRHDIEGVAFTADLSDPATSPLARRTFPGTAYTAGAKVTPFPWLMLRGSYATGRQAPPLLTLSYAQSTNYNYYLQDPKRPGDYQNDFENQYLLLDSGNPALKSIHASTLSLGAVLNPSGGRRPRLAIDYSRIRRRGDVVRINESIALAHEDELPGHVTRALLTDADRALGYTAGRVTAIDARALNAGSLDIDTIDGQFDWNLPLLGGDIHLYGVATLQLRNLQRSRFDAGVDRIGFSDGPLKWRANGGIDWTRGATTLGLNLQYFGRYRFYSVALADFAASLTEDQDSPWLPSQAYLDLHAARRLRIGGQEVQLDLGIVNLLDSSPPLDVNNSLIGYGFSYYGDPRRRRLELSLGTRF